MKTTMQWTLALLLAAATLPGAWAAPVAGGLFPLGTCPVSGEKLGSMGDVVVKDYDGREVRFCCKACVGKFESDQAAWLEKVDAAIVAQQAADYPLDTCPVSGEKLGSMGDPIDRVVGNRLVRLCCKGCVKGLEKDPAAALAKLDAAIIEAQGKTYPLDTCAVSGEKLGSMGKPVDRVVGNRLVRLCCKGCDKGLEKDPAAALAKLDAAQ